MSTEYIQAVSIRQGRVYLTSKSSNDDVPYHAWHCESLSKVYGEEGQPGLDREILRMLCEYAVLKGQDPSIKRYRHARRHPRKSKSAKRRTRRSRRRMISSRPRIRNTHLPLNLRQRVTIG